MHNSWVNIWIDRPTDVLIFIAIEFQVLASRTATPLFSCPAYHTEQWRPDARQYHDHVHFIWKRKEVNKYIVPCDLEIWRVALKNNRAPLLSNTKLCASFHHHMWIQTGVTVRKRLSRVLASVTLTSDLWPLPFAWTSLLSLVITPENFMMIRWGGHSKKGVTDRRTDGRTEPFIELLGRS